MQLIRSRLRLSKTNGKLAEQLIRLILSLYLGVAVGSTAVQMTAEFQLEKQNLTSQIRGLASTFEPAINEALWNYDDEQLEAVMRGFYQSPEVFGLEVLNLDGDLWRLGHYQTEDDKVEIAQFSETVSLKKLEQFGNLYSSSVELVRGGQEDLGSLTVFYSSSTVVERVWSTFLVTLMAAFMKTLCLWLIAVAVINRLVSEPIERITNDVEAFDVESRNAVAAQVLKRDNELSTLEQANQIFFQTIIDRNQALFERDQEVEAYKQHLEEMVAIRTDPLNEAMKQLKEANRVKSEFLAAMSHEIRTPMNAVLGGLQLLNKSELDTRQKQLLETINHGGRDLMTIINDILDYSKIEAERLNLEVIPFDLIQLINRVVEMFRPSAEEKSLNLSFESEGGTPLILLGDPTRVAQVFNNMLSNAIKFTEQGEISIDVAQPVEVAERLMRTEITVTDTGIGIEAEQLEGLFDLFSQADSSTTRKYGGTGLGLAICRKLLEAMSSEVTVVSEPGRGTSFKIWLTLPLSQEPLVEVEPEVRVKSIRSVGILLVDDVEMNREIAMAMLEDEGHQVLEASNGLEAVRVFEEQREEIQVVLMDCLMPEMDGYEATRQIRSLEAEHQYSPVPIIALTANSASAVRDECLDAGMTAFISKPFDEVELLATIDSCVSGVADGR